MGGVPAVSGSQSERGLTLIELLLVMGLAAVLAGLTVPVTAQASDALRVRHAAGFVASRLRLARLDAVQRIRSVGLVFDEKDGEWRFSVCEDGNGNGLRRAEIAAGIDQCLEGPHDIGQMFPGARVAVDPNLPGPEGSAASPDPVRFGVSNIASFSPAGSCTPGTLYLRSEEGRQYAVRLGSATGRTRILRYDPGRSGWVAG
jgi:prepilin-type N-terminal cleavage/methylation domain-containing protein